VCIKRTERRNPRTNYAGLLWCRRSFLTSSFLCHLEGTHPKNLIVRQEGGRKYIQRDRDRADGAKACGGEKDSQRPRSNGSYPSSCLAGQRAPACGSPSGPHCQSWPRRRSVEPPASGAAANNSEAGHGQDEARGRRGNGTDSEVTFWNFTKRRFIVVPSATSSGVNSSS
jgi:hypothetical protein